MQGTATIQVVHGSTGRAFPGRCPGRSYRPSPHSDGVSRRQEGSTLQFDVDRGVAIAIVIGAADGARPLAIGQHQRFVQPATDRAPLRGRKPPPDVDVLLPIPTAFVADEAVEGTKCRIGRRTGQVVVADYSSNIQILHADEVKTSHKIRRDFVEVVRTRVGNTAVQAGDARLLPVPASTTLLPTRQDALGTCELPGPTIEYSRILDYLPGRQGGKPVDAEVHTNLSSCLRQQFDWLVEDEGHKIPPIATLGYRRSTGGTCKLPRPANLQPAKLGHHQRSGLGVPPETITGVCRGLITSLPLERRVPTAPFEEFTVRMVQMPKCLTHRHRRDSAHPSALRLSLEIGKKRMRLFVVDLASSVVSIRSEAQAPIVDVATGTKGPGEDLFLFGRRVEAETVVHKHYEAWTRGETQYSVEGGEE